MTPWLAFDQSAERLINEARSRIGYDAVPVDEMVLEFVAHRENHRIIGQPFCEHDGWAALIIEVRTTKLLELVGPKVNVNALVFVYPTHITLQHA